MRGPDLRSKYLSREGQRGFTIVELLIVVVVIAILAAIIIVSFNGITTRAKEASVMADVRQAATVLTSHQVREGVYPASCEVVGVEVSGDHKLECSLTDNGFCIAVSNGTVAYQATEEDPVPRKGNCKVIPDTEMAKLLASDATAGDFFGEAVAISGDTAIVGAWRHNSARGSAYVFTRNGDSWTQQSKLAASDHSSGNGGFGVSVAISGDTAIIGRLNGAAYIFVRSGGAWTEQAKLAVSDGGSGSTGFGASVALSGNTAVVSQQSDSSNRGAAYIFTRSGGTWSQQAKLTAADGDPDDNFGNDVSVSGDTAIIGALYDDDHGNNSGSAYIFSRSGGAWSQQAKLTNVNGQALNFFGISVDISGNTAVVGERGDNNSRGAAYIFTRNGSTWSRQAKLLASGTIRSHFGSSVAIAGNTVIIGALPHDKFGSGYIFTRTGSTWTQQAVITASDAVSGDGFLGAVAISGKTAIITAPQDDDHGNNSGSAYIFQDLN